MNYIIYFFYGVLMAYFGLISPGMLNMTSLKIRMMVGITESFKFAAGAALIVLFQSGIAVLFADYFVENPQIIKFLKMTGVFVFTILAVFFFNLSRKELKLATTNKRGNYFLRGMGMSLINMLAIPFYLGMSIYLASINKIDIDKPAILLFVTGASVGSFLLFLTYILFAKYIGNKVSFIAKNINIILSLLFVFLAIITFFKIIS